MREIRYTVYLGGRLSQLNAAQGGSQGEDNVTTVIFEFDYYLTAQLSALSEEGEIYYRIKAIDGGGSVYSSDLLSTTVSSEGKTEIQYPIPNELTAAGGTISLFLIITRLGIEGVSDKVWYSFPAKIMLQPTDLDKDMDELRSIDEALVAARTARDEAADSADSAEAAKNGAEGFAEKAASSAEDAKAAADSADSAKAGVDVCYSEILRTIAPEIRDDRLAAEKAKSDAEDSAAAAANSATDAETFANNAASSAEDAKEALSQAATVKGETDALRIDAQNAATQSEASANNAASSAEEAKAAAEAALAESVGIVEGYPANEAVIPEINYSEERGYYLTPSVNMRSIPLLSDDYDAETFFLKAKKLNDGSVVLGNGEFKNTFVEAVEFTPNELAIGLTTEEISVISWAGRGKRLANWITIYLEIPKASAKEPLVVLLDDAYAGYIPNGLNTSVSYVRFSLRWNGYKWENYAITGASVTTGGNIYSTTVYHASNAHPSSIKIQGTSGGVFPVGTRYYIYAGLKGE